MILATVGTQLPFPRLLRALDRIARTHGLTVIAQTCQNEPDLTHIEQRPFVAPAEFDRLAQSAHVIVGHAGIGTIIGADRVSRPLILFPRKASLGEHRNEHQLATASSMEAREGIHVAWDEERLETLLTGAPLAPLQRGDSPTRPALIAEITRFVQDSVR
ncbi:MAG: glycosyltransferase [Sphingobium sp.]